jgi:hypothetical protein
LVDVEGKDIDRNPKLLSVASSGLVYVWGEEYWLRDLNQPETDEEV